MAAKRVILEKPQRFVLYKDAATPSLNLDAISEYVHDMTGVTAVVRDDFFVLHGGNREDLARRIAGTKVRDISKEFSAVEPSYGEIAFELRMLEDSSKKVHGTLYDGGKMMNLLRGLIPAKERTWKVQHIIFTSRLAGTYESDGRYHAHVNACGYPSIISTSGVVEAPAKPREYYVLKQKFIEGGEAVPFELLKEKFAGQFIDYDDPRLTGVLKGYALQCAVYAITGEAFCDKRICRLFNAHWQSEVLKAQLGGKNLCKRHQEMLKTIRRS